MSFLYLVLDAFKFSFRRILAHKLTTLSAIIGLTLSISLLISVSLYSDRIYFQSFLDNVAKTRENPENEVSITNPSFAFLFHYFGGWHGDKSWDDLLPLDEYITQDGIKTLNIPSIDVIRLFETDNFYIFPQDESSNVNTLYLTRTSFGVLSALDQHIILLKGNYPKNLQNPENQQIEVLVSEKLASKANLHVGQIFLAYIQIIDPTGKRETQHTPIEIVGIWQAKDPSEDYWIFAPSYYESILFTAEETFFTRLGSQSPKFVHNAYWYLLMDANFVHADEIDGLLNRIQRIERAANEYQPNLWLSISPKNALENYADDARLLRILLYAFAIPVIGLILAFVGLVSKLSTDQSANTIAVVRSRGGTRSQIIWNTVLDGMILGMVSLGLSLFISKWITLIILTPGGFFEFSKESEMRVGISTGTILIGLIAVLIFVGMLLFPVSRTARSTIITHLNKKARSGHNPWWQRIGLDIILFIPAAYGSYLLQKQGSLALLGSESFSNDPFRNPLLFLVPSLSILSLSLFSLRLLHPIMVGVEGLLSFTNRVGLIIAIRQITRRPTNYHTPLMILILTVSLFIYTESLSDTFNQHLTDQEYYKVGADIQFFDPGDSSSIGDSYNWDFFPVDEYTRVPGVLSATRMGRYAVHIKTARIQEKGLFIGIDRLVFPSVAFWRQDFSKISLGALMNKLAEDPTNVLMNAKFLQQNGLRVGDTIRATVKTFQQQNELTLKVAGSIDYFPTWYPDQGPLLVGNLDNLFENASGIFPYYVLLKTELGVDPDEIQRKQIRTIDQRIRPVDWKTPLQNITKAQSAPERQGLLGFLFLGIVIAVLLTVLAFLLHLVFSYKQRSIEFGVLRAGGLSTYQMIAILVWEFTFLILIGGAIGTGLGWLASLFYIPYLQIGEGISAMIPPFQVFMPWTSIIHFYGFLGILFGLSLIVSILMLRRIRIFEVIKLGEIV